MQLGFGATGAWAAPWFDEKKAEQVLGTALDAGLNHLDTAGFYTGGQADERLARCLKNLGALNRPGLVISTKIGKRITEEGRLVRDFSEDGIRRAIDRHIRLFGGQPPDIVYMHGPDEHELHGSLPVLLSLKSEGLIGAIGSCHDGNHLMAAARTDGINILMGRYHFLNRVNAESFHIARQTGKKVVSIAPLAQGLWQRSMFLPKRASDVWYLARALRRDPRTFMAAQRSAWIRDVEGWPPAHLALAYVRMNPDIDVVLTTSTQSRHITDTATGFERDIPPGIRSLLAGKGAVTD